MDAIAVPITEHEDVKRIFELYQQNGMGQEKADAESLLKHIAYMETQFEKVFDELQNVRAQGKDTKPAKAYDTGRGVLAGVQRLFHRTAVLLTNIGRVADSAMRKIEGLGQRSEKTSVDKSIRVIKSARTDSKTPVPVKESRESR